MSETPKVSADDAADLIRGYYADVLTKKLEAAAAAHEEALAAARNLTSFNETDELPEPRDAFLIAVWTGSRVIRQDAIDIGAGGKSWDQGDRRRAERTAVLRWLLDGNYDIGYFAEEMTPKKGKGTA